MTTQSDNAVQTEKTPHQVPVVEVMKNLDKKDLKVAYEAIHASYDLQVGIEDMKAKIERNTLGIGDHVLSIARQARTHCVAQGFDLTLTRHYFLALCTQAETVLINKHIEDGEKKAISTLIPVWPVHKSNIAKGMEPAFGIDPLTRIPDTATKDKPEGVLEYASCAQYVAAVKEKAKETGANNTGSQAGEKRQSSEQTAKVLGTITSTWDSSLQAAIQVLSQGLNKLDKEEQTGWAPKVLQLAAEVTAYYESPERKERIAAKMAAMPEAPQSGEIVKDENGKVVGTTSSTPEITDEELDPGTKAALQATIDKDKEPEAPKGGKRRGARAAA